VETNLPLDAVLPDTVVTMVDGGRDRKAASIRADINATFDIADAF
jgi:hypothetical protein